MKSLRIAFFSHDAELYGASRSLVSLVTGLQQNDIDCLIIIPYRGPLLKHIEDNNLKYAIAHYPSWFYKPEKVSFSQKVEMVPKFIFQLTRSIFDRRLNALLKGYDLLVTNTSAVPIGAFLSLKLRKNHIWYIRELVELDYGFKYILGKRLFLFLIDKTKFRLFNSEFVMNYYLQQLSHKNVNEVIYNGIYPRKKFVECKNEYTANAKVRDSTFVFCLVGFIHAGKGQLQAVEAIAEVVKEFKDVKLFIVGSGESSSLQQYVNDKDLSSHVVLTGYLPDVHRIFLQSHCLLNCARFEAFGRTTVEAMAYSLPVIGNNTAGTAEIVRHNYTGLLYDGTTEDLVVCMKTLINVPALARTLGENGWNEAHRKYTIEQYVDSFSDFIKRQAISE